MSPPASRRPDNDSHQEATLRISHHKHPQSYTGETVAQQGPTSSNCQKLYRRTLSGAKLTANPVNKLELDFVLYHRHDLTEEVPAEFFSVSQPTILRVINLIETATLKILELVIKPLEQAIQVTGSLVICWNAHTYLELAICQNKRTFSGKLITQTGFGHQDICTIDGKLLAITGPLSRIDIIFYCQSS